MLQSNAKPAFLTACACNLAFAIIGGFSTETLAANLFASLAGPLAFIAAAALGLRLLLNEDEGMHRRWIKAALVFLALGPFAFWFLQWPAVQSMMCLDCTFDPAFVERALGDVVQSQIAITAVALVALFCATRATTAPLDELAV